MPFRLLEVHSFFCLRCNLPLLQFTIFNYSLISLTYLHGKTKCHLDLVFSHGHVERNGAFEEHNHANITSGSFMLKTRHLYEGFSVHLVCMSSHIQKSYIYGLKTTLLTETIRECRAGQLAVEPVWM